MAPLFLTSALDGGEWSSSRSGRFTSGERAPGTHSIEGWLGGLQNWSRHCREGKYILLLPGIELQSSSL
jgi:hypothetical protein